MATCQVWRLATISGRRAWCVAVVATAPRARRRSVMVLPGPTSWASMAQADAVCRLPLAGVRAAATRTCTVPGVIGAAGGGAVNRWRRGRPPLAIEATPVEIHCL